MNRPALQKAAVATGVHLMHNSICDDSGNFRDDHQWLKQLGIPD